ncbi:hypothetical protein OPQ81_007226 [Rhizoctonia solani]|nr:hypothetical protein OPQ81_007226 [Rhizoctonia solani]
MELPRGCWWRYPTIKARPEGQWSQFREERPEREGSQEKRGWLIIPGRDGNRKSRFESVYHSLPRRVPRQSGKKFL